MHTYHFVTVIYFSFTILCYIYSKMTSEKEGLSDNLKQRGSKLTNSLIFRILIENFPDYFLFFLSHDMLALALQWIYLLCVDQMQHLLTYFFLSALFCFVVDLSPIYVLVYHCC